LVDHEHGKQDERNVGAEDRRRGRLRLLLRDGNGAEEKRGRDDLGAQTHGLGRIGWLIETHREPASKGHSRPITWTFTSTRVRIFELRSTGWISWAGSTDLADCEVVTLQRFTEPLQCSIGWHTGCSPLPKLQGIGVFLAGPGFGSGVGGLKV